jgi:monoterpene epsilon-lactone hydrolase
VVTTRAVSLALIGDQAPRIIRRRRDVQHAPRRTHDAASDAVRAALAGGSEKLLAVGAAVPLNERACMPYCRHPPLWRQAMADSQIATVRALLASLPRPEGLAARRARLVALTSQYAIPADVRLQAVDAGGVRAEWTTTPVAHTQRAMLFLHGGAYIAGGIESHRHLVAQAGRVARVRTLALDYRLAPEHPFPAALDDALAGYHYLLSQGYAPGELVLAGESAGGGLALATLVALRDAGTPLPGCVWLSSPWTDLAMSGESMLSKADVDPLIQKPYLLEAAAAYLHGAEPRTPLASPLFADLRGLPPLLIQVGTAETLLDDSIRLARAAALADVRVELQTWPEMIHAWTLYYPQLDDGARALDAMGAFVQHTLDAAAQRAS